MKPILDVACGGKMFYFDKNDPRVLFCDNRRIKTTLCDGREFEVDPDIQADFTNLPFKDERRRPMPHNRHPIPPRRRQRLTIIRLTLGLVVLVALICIIAPTCGEPTPAATSQPYYIIVSPTATPTVWVQYSVGLDADLQRYIVAEAEEREINPAIIMAICEIESNCDPSKLGDGGNAWGIMQIHPIYFLAEMEALSVTDLRDPYQNILLGLAYLQELYATGHDTAWVLMAYNGGQSYASTLAAQGVTSNYAKQVMERAEELTESAQIMTD
jgi:hypothetical protein